MKKFALSALVIFLISCDPPMVLIVENQTGDSIYFRVNTRQPIGFDSVRMSGALVPDKEIKLKTLPAYFHTAVPIVKEDSLNYKFTLPPQNEVWVPPSAIGMPFRSISYQLRGKTYEVVGDAPQMPDNVEIISKPMATTIVKINR